MRNKDRLAVAGFLALGAVLGCGGVTRSHTQVTAGPVRSVSIEPATAVLAVGAARTFTVRATDNRGLDVPGVQFEWRSSNPSVVSVDQTGTAVAVAPGVAGVIAVETATGIIARATVTVSLGPVLPTFDRDIKPLAKLACSCHEPGAPAAATGAMTDRFNLIQRGYVVPGNPDGSTYLTTGAGGANHPGANAWGTHQQIVREWIEQGATP
ncbi:MAG: Ig-like domain-containing protein [Armatimonadota bacterium]|nr:Ig-like domain-containing protein [Armatimonadota bacterium]